MADVDITSLSVEISAESQGAELNINKLANAIANLRTKGNVSGVCDSLDRLSSSISKLKDSSKGIGSIFKNLEKISSISVSGIDFTGLSGKLESLKSELQPLQNIDTSGLKAVGSAMNAIAKIPSINDKLDAKVLDGFKTACDSISKSLTPLASQLDKVGNAFAKLPPQLSKVVTQANRVTAANEKQRKSYLSLSNQLNGFMRNMAKLVSLKAIATYLGEAAANFNNYYEAANLFGVSMKEMTGEASDFIDKMETLLGIDPTEAMNNMATIQGLTTSFGVASDKAYILSKNLTQLGYDLSSLKNISVAESFTKIQAAISGELEPIRRLGVDLSQARLQQELLSLGFTQSVSSLSQADKAILRYIAIMKQTTDAQGDFARTLDSPANMIRVLQAQFNSLARSVGSVLYPALKSILPPLIAAVELVKELVQALASLMGVKVEFPDFKGNSSAVADTSDALDNAATSAKKAQKALKDYTMGFDELNIINPTQDTGSSGSGSSGGASGNILGDVDLSQYDMFAEYVGNQVESIKEKLKGLLPIITGIGAGFLAWEISSAIFDALEKIHDKGSLISALFSGLNPIVVMVAAAVALVTARMVALYQSSEPFRKGLERIKDLVKTIKDSFANGFMSSLTNGELRKAVDRLKDAFKKLKEAIKGLLPESVINALKDLKDLIDELGLDFTDFFLLFVGFNSGNIPLLFFEGITIALRALGSEGEEVYSSLKEKISSFFENAGKAVADFAAAAVNAFASFVEWLSELPEKVKVAVDSIGKWFSEIPEKIGNAVSSAKDKFIGWVSGLATTAKEEVPKVISSIVSFFASIPDKIAFAIGYALGTIVKWVAELIVVVTTEVPKVISGILAFFAELPSKIWDKIINVYQKIKDWVSGTVKVVTTEVPKIISGVVGFFTELPSKIWDKITGTYQKVSDWASGMTEKAKEVIPSVIDSFVSFFKEIPGKLKALGKDIVDGLFNGVKDAMHTVVDKVGELADSFVNGFKTALGIHSPSKVFYELGGYIDQGLANGINAGLSVVRDAALSLVNAATNAGQQFIDSGAEIGQKFIDNLDEKLNSQWQKIENSLSSDFLGSIKTLGDTIKNGDLEKLGTWAASYFYHAMDDEQKKQIKAIAENSLKWLTQGLSGAWQSISRLASSFIGKLVPATQSATIAQLGLNTAMDANVVLFIISVIGMLVGAIINFSKTNDDVASDFTEVWGTVSDVFSYIFQGILYIMGWYVQGFVNIINVLIGAYNLVAKLWGGHMDYVENPVFEWAEKVGEDRKKAQEERKKIAKEKKSGNVPGTSESENAEPTATSYTSSSVTVDFDEQEMREAVYNGTYNAMLDIVQRYGDQISGGKELKIYLDGKQLTASVEKTQNERGQSVMGTEAYSY